MCRSVYSSPILYAAARCGHIESVRALLAAGARADIEDSGGATALHHAARHGKRNVVELLLESVEVDRCDSHDRTSTRHAAEATQLRHTHCWRQVRL